MKIICIFLIVITYTASSVYTIYGQQTQDKRRIVAVEKFISDTPTKYDRAITEKVIEIIKNVLDFDLPLFLSLSQTEMKKYLSNFKFNIIIIYNYENSRHSTNRNSSCGGNLYNFLFCNYKYN